MRRRLLSTLVVISLLVLTLAGCGKKEGLDGYSKKELIEMYNLLNNEYTAILQQKNDIESLYNSLNVDSKPEAAIGFVGDATGAYTFTSRDAKIIFPETFRYPGAEQTKSTGDLYITNDVSVAPGSNWIVKVNGTTIELEHSNGISGIIKVGKVNQAFESAQLRDEVVAPWFDANKIPSGSRTYLDVFHSSGGVAIGVDATAPIMIDSEDAFLRCGMCCSNGCGITYVFTYRTQQDINKDESIINIIESIKVSGGNITVNQ